MTEPNILKRVEKDGYNRTTEVTREMELAVELVESESWFDNEVSFDELETKMANMEFALSLLKYSHPDIDCTEYELGIAQQALEDFAWMIED